MYNTGHFSSFSSSWKSEKATTAAQTKFGGKKPLLLKVVYKRKIPCWMTVKDSCVHRIIQILSAEVNTCSHIAGHNSSRHPAVWFGCTVLSFTQLWPESPPQTFGRLDEPYKAVVSSFKLSGVQFDCVSVLLAHDWFTPTSCHCQRDTRGLHQLTCCCLVLISSSGRYSENSAGSTRWRRRRENPPPAEDVWKTDHRSKLSLPILTLFFLPSLTFFIQNSDFF